MELCKKKDSKPNNTTLSSGSVVVLLLLGLFKIYSLKCVGEDNKKKKPKLFFIVFNLQMFQVVASPYSNLNSNIAHPALILKKKKILNQNIQFFGDSYVIIVIIHIRATPWTQTRILILLFLDFFLNGFLKLRRIYE